MATSFEDDDFVPVPLAVSTSSPTPVSYATSPLPAGYSLSDLKEINTLSSILLANPSLVFPPPPVPAPNPRSVQINKLKEEGNLHFRNRDYNTAIKLYTLSADMAASRPVFEANVYAREELALALCNRSAAYGLVGKWEEALVDADAVTLLKRPWVKGWFRKGKALQGLQRLEEAREALLLGLQFDPTAEDLTTAVLEVEKLLREREDKPKIAEP